jgi:aminoglycoside phosphotransferase (APT) family kinase protein
MDPQPSDPRAAEGLPSCEALERYLAPLLPGLGPIAIERFTSGYSNLTYRLRTARGTYVLRRPPVAANVKGGHDMTREFRLLTALHPVWPKLPRALVSCADPAIIGAPFFVMEYVPGLILRAGQDQATLTPARLQAAAHALVDTLAELHALDARTSALAELGRPEGYVERQVSGWCERWQRARTEPQPELEQVAAWLATQHITPGPPAVVHNDFKFDNLVLDPDDPGRLRCVLDWELATLGDARLDLGTTLAYWVDDGDTEDWRRQAPVPHTSQPGCLDREGVVERYQRSSGRTLAPQELLFVYVLGLFKVAVIAQQIFARYSAGHTRDPRFAGLGEAVRACGRQAGRALDQGRLTPLVG